MIKKCLIFQMMWGSELTSNPLSFLKWYHLHCRFVVMIIALRGKLHPDCAKSIAIQWFAKDSFRDFFFSLNLNNTNLKLLYYIFFFFKPSFFLYGVSPICCLSLSWRGYLDWIRFWLLNQSNRIDVQNFEGKKLCLPKHKIVLFFEFKYHEI